MISVLYSSLFSPPLQAKGGATPAFRQVAASMSTPLPRQQQEHRQQPSTSSRQAPSSTIMALDRPAHWGRYNSHHFHSIHHSYRFHSLPYHTHTLSLSLLIGLYSLCSGTAKRLPAATQESAAKRRRSLSGATGSTPATQIYRALPAARLRPSNPM